jgi:hypothetical protein
MHFIKKDASKDSEDENVQDDRAEDGMGMRRAPQSSKQMQNRRRVRS